MNGEIRKEEVKDKTLRMLCEEYPFVHEFFAFLSITYPKGKEDVVIEDILSSMDEFELEQKGIDKEELLDSFVNYIWHMQVHSKQEEFQISSITILGGQNKDHEKEEINLTLHAGEVLSIVGPTGSGKSRLLADIEWMAQKDTPTRRQILINGKIPPRKWRFSIEHKLVAQLSQNMNFVMDLSVGEFIQMHAESRMITWGIKEKIQTILSEANKLAGEKIRMDTPVTALSGGQSRALMIADTAFLSTSPIVLIDEIENAGIDRTTAVNLLMKREKIVMIATHDPVLALSADRRLIIKNGGMYRLLNTSMEEKNKLVELEKMNAVLMDYRERLKAGEALC